MPKPDGPSSGTLLPAIVLAAGVSARMGRFKPLLDIGGRPMIRRVVEVLQAVCDPVIVVTGHRADEVREAAGGVGGVRDVLNADYESGGMVSSAKVGVGALPPEAEGFVLSLGDQPAVRAETLSQLVDAWRKGAAAIAVPVYHGKRGHPIVLSIRCAADVMTLKGEETLKSVVERYTDQMAEVMVEDAGVVMDVDTPADYEEVLTYWDDRHRVSNATRGAGHGPTDR